MKSTPSAPDARPVRTVPSDASSSPIGGGAERAGLPAEELDRLLAQTLDSLATLVPYDLATVFELDGDRLTVRMARGALVDDRVLRHTLDLGALPSMRRSLETRRPFAPTEDDHAREGDAFDGVLDLPSGHSCMVVPLYARDRSLGVLTFDRVECVPYDSESVGLAGVMGQLLGLAFLLAENNLSLDRAREGLRRQNEQLRDRAGVSKATDRILTARSPAMRQVAEMARRVAVTDASVLILGETGVGKEVLAQAIHDWSPRRDQPFVTVNCAALPAELVEAELFGHTRGAFSGADKARPGRFRSADGGTVLLDEVGELPLPAQAKLLRVLQEGMVQPLGSDKVVRVDARVLAATHVDLQEAVAQGRFRQDLFYRLAVFPLTVPPLRERPEDIEELVASILHDLAERTGRGPWRLDGRALQRFHRLRWPGNVRELANFLERSTILQPRGVLMTTLYEDLAPLPKTDTGLGTLEEVERAHIEAVLEHTRGQIYGRRGAARVLGLKETTLQSRLKRLGLVPKSYRSHRTR